MPNQPRGLEIRLLGNPLLTFHGAALKFRAPVRAFALLAYATLHPGEILRDRLAYALWPDATDEEARTSLRRHLHLLQAALPAGTTWIESDRRTVAWAGHEHAWADTMAFDELGASSETLAASVELYRGDLLSGIDDEWIVPLRERYREQQAERLRTLVRRCRERSDIAAATDYGARLIRLDPWREDVVRELMEIRVATGDCGGAARLYHDLAQRLRDELGVEPARETTEAYAMLVRSGGGAASRVSRSDSMRTSRLVLPVTSFHGRERDIEAVRELLRSRRLVTLAGPGGVGKTRLAIETVSRAEPEFEDGAHVVDLAQLEDGALVTARVAQTLGIREPLGATIRATLVAELRDRDVLLVLDSCEHLLADAAQFAEMLVRSTSRLRLLCTSREPLRIADENVYRVQPLPVPAPLRFDGNDPLQGPAVQLFVDRALARNQALELRSHARTLASICAKLDGLPLAIELAAANLGGMSIDALAATIDERLASLGGGWRTANPRQHTLQAVFAWSYQLLSEPLRRLFLQLAVFRGNFSVAAAHALNGEEARDWESLQLVAALAEQSLLVVEDGPGEPRYRMLETTRTFAGELLAASGTETQAQQVHAAFFARIAEQARPAHETLSDAEWLPPLYADRDNFSAALERTLGAGREVGVGAAIAAGLVDYWLIAGQESIAIRWLEAATRGDPSCIHAWVGLAAVYRRGYRFADAIAAAQEVLPALHASTDRVTLCRALVAVGNSLVSSAAAGDRATIDRGRAMVVESLQIAEAHRHLLRIAEAHFALGIIAHYLEDASTALHEFEVAQRIFNSIGKTSRKGNASLSIALIAYGLGDIDRAAAIAQDLTRDGRVFHRVQMAQSYELLGTIALDRGDLEQAREQTERALAIAVDTGLDPMVDSRLARVARIEAASDRSDVAARLFGYVRRCEELGSLGRPPQERDSEARIVEDIRRRLGHSFPSLWEEGYQALRSEMVSMVLNRPAITVDGLVDRA